MHSYALVACKKQQRLFTTFINVTVDFPVYIGLDSALSPSFSGEKEERMSDLSYLLKNNISYIEPRKLHITSLDRFSIRRSKIKKSSAGPRHIL